LKALRNGQRLDKILTERQALRDESVADRFLIGSGSRFLRLPRGSQGCNECAAHGQEDKKSGTIN